MNPSLPTLPACAAILCSLFLLASCQSSDSPAPPPKPRPNMPAEVATLFRNGYAMCKLDVLRTEGVAAIGSYGGTAEAASAATEISGISSQSSQVYYNALLKLRKFPQRLVEGEVGRQYQLQPDPRAAMLVQPVILRHIDAIYTGIELTPADIRQDFESQRYRAYVPVD